MAHPGGEIVSKQGGEEYTLGPLAPTALSGAAGTSGTSASATSATSASATGGTSASATGGTSTSGTVFDEEEGSFCSMASLACKAISTSLAEDADAPATGIEPDKGTLEESSTAPATAVSAKGSFALTCTIGASDDEFSTASTGGAFDSTNGASDDEF